LSQSTLANKIKEETFMRRTHLAAYFFALGILICGGGRARAQDDSRGWEAGGQFSAFNVTNGKTPSSTFVVGADQRGTEPGFGGRVGYNFNRYLAAEAEFNFFPRERALDDAKFTGGRKLQGLFGVKVGRRFQHFGVFAKARPGFVHFKDGDLQFPANNGCILIFPPPLACFESVGRTDFAFDAGGVVEFYTSRHAVIRIDAGDTVLHSRAHNIPGREQDTPTGPTLPTIFVVPAATTHNFQGSVGFAYRF
jgi:Outer membrane protein beta-barrel domain